MIHRWCTSLVLLPLLRYTSSSSSSSACPHGAGAPFAVAIYAVKYFSEQIKEKNDKNYEPEVVTPPTPVLPAAFANASRNAWEGRI